MWESRGISRARATACLLAAGFGACYLAWRLTSTLNPAAMWFAIILWVAELYGFVSSVLFYYTAWNTKPRRAWRPAAKGISVIGGIETPGSTTSALVQVTTWPAALQVQPLPVADTKDNTPGRSSVTVMPLKVGAVPALVRASV